MVGYLSKKQTDLLVFAAWVVYAAATLGRLTYSASMVRIISELSLTNAEAGSVLSAFAVTYGAGQLINGLLSKYYNVRYVIPVTMLLSGAVTFLLPFSDNSTSMAVLWAVNGAAQSVLWSLIVRTLSVYVSKKHIGHAIVVISTTTAAGTALAYALSAVFVALGIWKVTFVTAAVLCVASGGIWSIIVGKLGKAQKTESHVSSAVRKKKRVSRYFIAIFLFMCVAAFFNGFIRDGVNGWFPKILTESFGIGDSASIIITLILPLFSVFGAVLARKTYYRIQNIGTLLLIFFGVSSVLCLAGYFIYPVRLLVPTVIIFTLVACGMAAVNNVVLGLFPIDRADSMDAGASSGILDTMCYVGSSAAGSVIGSISQMHGWESVFLILASCALICSAISAVFSIHRSRIDKY